MRILNLLFCTLIAALLVTPALATECANAGTAPGTAPDDTGDGNATACGGSAVAAGFASTALGTLALSPGATSIALGPDAWSVGDNSMALGYLASSGGIYSIALGYDADSVGENSVAIGPATNATGNYSTALGYDATSAGPNSIALGDGSSSAGLSSTALGYGAASIGNYSAALGYGTSTAGEGSAALGALASSAGLRSTALGAYAFADQPDTLILGSIAGVNGAPVYANIGIGTSAPSQAVDVERSAAAARFQLTSFTAVADQAPQYIQRRARGTRTAPTAVQNNDNLGLFSFRGYNGTAMGGSRATITAQAAGTFSGSSTPTRLIFATTPVGSTAPQSVLVITPDGKVQVKGVNLNVPDYVFEDEYELMPLAELRAFIDTNGHLPGIAPAHEVQSEGLDLAGSQLSQLQKIEELTLYALEQESRLADQQQRIERLEKQLASVLPALD